MSKILVFGDSIAYGKWDEKGGWVARLREYVDQTHNIGKRGNEQVYNLGIPGEMALRMIDRVEKELSTRIEKNDKSLVIYAIGLNDANPANWMTLKQTPPEKFKQIVKELYAIAIKQGAQVAFIGLTPINEDHYLENSKFKGKFFNHHVIEYEEYLTKTCTELSSPKLSFYDELKDSSFPDLLVDGIHPNSEGHQILFNKVLSFLQQERLINVL